MLKPEQIPLAQRQAFSVAEFCALNHVSRTHFYELLKQGKGPRLMRVGRRFLISAGAAADWQKAMEVSTQSMFKNVDLEQVR